MWGVSSSQGKRQTCMHPTWKQQLKTARAKTPLFGHQPCCVSLWCLLVSCLCGLLSAALPFTHAAPVSKDTTPSMSRLDVRCTGPCHISLDYTQRERFLCSSCEHRSNRPRALNSNRTPAAELSFAGNPMSYHDPVVGRVHTGHIDSCLVPVQRTCAYRTWYVPLDIFLKSKSIRSEREGEVAGFLRCSFVP